jgi:hypothetical protein
MKKWVPSWSWDACAVLLGFALTLVSLVGGTTYLEPSLRSLEAISEDIASTRIKMEIIRDALALDDFTKQLSGTVFTLKPATTADVTSVEILHELKHRALVHRHDGVRAVIAELALAGEIDFASSSNTYEALVDAETRNFTFDNFQAANAFDEALTSKAVADQGADRLSVTALQRLRTPARAESVRRGLFLALVSSLGGLFLLIATLKATAHAPTPVLRSIPDPRQAAIHLLTEALHETRARIARAGPL